MIINTPRVLDLVYLSILSTGWRKIVANRNEKTNIPMMVVSIGNILVARKPIKIISNNLYIF